MRAVIFDGSDIRLSATRQSPTLQPGEAVIEPTRAGVCATDIEICKGYMHFEGVFGHEFVGVVTQVHNDADNTWVGKKVVGSINAVCGKCDMCTRGLSAHCRDRTVLGILNRDGCFADAFTLPVQNLVEVPDNLTDDEAVFAEPLAAAIHVLDHFDPRTNDPYITVLGDGRLGLLCAQVLAREYSTIRVIGKHHSKLNLCEKWGIAHRHIDDIGRRNDQDLVIDCTGSAEGLHTSMQLVRPRGRIILKTTVAPHLNMKHFAYDLSPLVINEVELIGSRCGSIATAIHALSMGWVDVLSLIDKRFRLDDALDAIRAAQQPGTLKVLIEI